MPRAIWTIATVLRFLRHYMGARKFGHVSDSFNSINSERFPGFDNLSLSFSAMETIFLTQRLDWKTALENTKGVYLIADKRNGKKYVGAAYGKDGLWSRWLAYLLTGHGWHSDELTKLILTEGIEYAREYFSLTLLEYRSMRTDDEVVIQRENFCKEALHTRGTFGYNKN